MDIKKIINRDMPHLTIEEQQYINKFNEALRSELIRELVLDIENKIVTSLQNDKEEFNEFIKDMIINGYKGLKNINTQGLLDLYLEKNDEIDFMNLIEKVSNENI